tara:strand:+ start:186 stop:476 length:291 start_codon:yes stop_codon:yes gene_type:complete
MGPLSSSHETADAQVTTVPTRLYGVVIGVTAANVDNKIELKNGTTSGDVLLTIDIGHQSVGPVVVNLPAESYIRFDSKMYLDVHGAVDAVTLMYQI